MVLARCCYVTAKKLDNLQTCLHWFNCTAKALNMMTSVSKIPTKMQIDNQIIHQELRFKYLGIDILGYWDVEAKDREQTTQVLSIAAYVKKHYIA